MASVDEKIMKLRGKIEVFEQKKRELDAKIKEAKSELANYENQKNSKVLSKINAEMAKKGISYDDLLRMLADTDMSSLQERIAN